jgi:hypothetical protein
LGRGRVLFRLGRAADGSISELFEIPVLPFGPNAVPGCIPRLALELVALL